ncbi:MAG: alpha-E domain-containing protein [Leptospirillia bacterium]
MLSRVAENIYWMARYIERAENTARLVNVTSLLLMDLPRTEHFGWSSINTITANQERFDKLYPEATEQNVVRFTVGERKNPGSILSSLTYARDNARTIREIIPRIAWETLNALHMTTKKNLPAARSQQRRYDYLQSVILESQKLTGILDGTMNRDEGYVFLQLGRTLERADMTTRTVDARFTRQLSNAGGREFENLEWMSMLRTLSAYQTYRRRMQIRIQRGDVLRFLLQDIQLPRSYHYCLRKLEADLALLPRHEAPIRTARRLKKAIVKAVPEDLTQSELHQFNDRLQVGLIALDQLIGDTYFNLSETTGDTGKRVGQA